MHAPSSVTALTNALVHQSALSQPLACRRHASFITKRMAFTFGILAVAPFFLAYRGAPYLSETLVFACAFAPLAAAVFVARTGRLVEAHGIAACGLVALSLTLWIGLGCDSSCAVAWLLAAQIEAVLAFEKRLTLSAGVVTSAALLGICVTAPLEGAISIQGTTLSDGLAGLALFYTLVITTGAWPSDSGLSRQDGVERETWRTMSRLLDDLVVCFDGTGSVVRASADGAAGLGVPAGDMMGRGLFERVHVADRPAFLKTIADAAHGDTPTLAEIRVRTSPRRTSDGTSSPPSYIWIAMRAGRVERGESGAAEVVAVLRDIDDARARDAEILASHALVEETTSAKDPFLANMSHELRTPLNAIIGFSDILSSRTLCPSDAEKQREYARIVHQSGQHLLSVVNAILDMSKLRSGTMAIDPERFDLIPLLDLCCDMVALKAKEGRVEIVRDYPDRLDALKGDKRVCKQILINLLSNAVKFTPEGGAVTISARPEGTALVVSVADTGIGIGATDLGRLGDPFFRARSSVNRPFEGTGLGLSVVRGLVGALGGTIAIESELGGGTCVKVCLPLECEAASRQASAKIETIARRPTPMGAPVSTDGRIKQIA